MREPELTAALKRLCSDRLVHLTLQCPQLRDLFVRLRRKGSVALTSLRSVSVTLTRRAGHACQLVAFNASYATHFPSVLHFATFGESCCEALTGLRLPALRSFTLHGTSKANPAHMSTRALRIYAQPDDNRPDYRQRVRRMLERAPGGVQQLSIAGKRARRPDSDCAIALLPPPSVEPHPLAACSYIHILHGLTMTDVALLLDSASPPVFAQQLTHLALAVH